MIEEGSSEGLAGDVVVVGAGYAGLAAALEARKRVPDVIILGRTGPFANNSSMGEGLFACVDTPMQKAMGVQDSPQLLAEDLLRANGHSVDPELVNIVAQAGVEQYEWLRSFGARFTEVILSPGHSVPRLHREATLNGTGVMKGLLQAAKLHGIDIPSGVFATELLQDKAGHIAGAKAIDKDGREIRVLARRGVVLAAGGFGRNREMIKEYAPKLADVPYCGAMGSTGDGIRMGLAVGAEAVNMDAAVVSPCCHATRKQSLGWGPMMHGAIMVNTEGRRFVDERLSYNLVVFPLMRQPNGMAFVVFDQRTASGVAARVERFQKLGMILEAETAELLASKLGVGTHVFRETIEAYNADVPSGVGRHALQGRLYAVPVTNNLVMTQGGLRINTRAQVMHKAGHPIPRLYAAGDSAAGLGGPPSLEFACTGYTSGSGYLGACSFGRIAGRYVAEEAPV